MKKNTFLYVFLVSLFIVTQSYSQITGPETINFDTGNNTSLGAVVNDGNGGSSDITGIQIDIYAISTSGVATNATLYYYTSQFPGPDLGGLSIADPFSSAWAGGLLIKTNDGSEFDFNGFDYEEYAGLVGGQFIVTGYKDGAATGSVTLAIDGTTHASFGDVEFDDAKFGDVDEVRIIIDNTTGTDFYGVLNSFVLGAANSGGGGGGSGLVVDFDTTSSSGNESVTTVNIPVSFDAGAIYPTDVTVNYTVTGTAASGTDFTALSGILTIPAWSNTANLTITITNDAVTESNETIIITLTGSSDATIGTNSTHTYTILDDDTVAAAVTIADVSGNEDDGAITVTATLDNPVSGGFTVDVSTVDGTATTADSDYTAVTSHTLTFTGTAGETKTFTITPTVDTKLESNETFTVSLSNLSGTAHSITITDTASITITNDDTAAVTIADVSGNENDGSITVTATLNNAVQGGFSVDVATANGTATTADSDYTAVAGHTLTFTGTAGETKTFTITPIADTKLENNETLTVSMGNLSGTSLSVDVTDTATVTINNDDAAVNNPPDAVDDSVITDTDLAFGEDDGARAITADILGNDTDPDVGNTLTVSTIDITGTAGLVTLVGGVVTYNPNGAFESLALGATATDTFTYTVSDGDGGTDTATVTITINGANDAPNAVDDSVVTDTDLAFGEDDGARAITADILGNDTDPDVGNTLTVSTIDITGTAGLVTLVGGVVTYNPNGAFESLALGATATDTFTYTISDGNGGTDTATVTITINGVDDIIKPTVTISAATSVTANGATLNGAITADGGATITERGFIYAKTTDNAAPTLAAVDGTTVLKVVVDGVDVAAFSKAITGLKGNTGYSVVAYATNAVGTTESTVQTFTTINTPPTFTSTPVLGITEGNLYVYVPQATDLDEDNVMISSVALPSWLELKNTSGPVVSTFATGFTSNFRGITVDPFGNVYAASTEGNLIYKITPSGKVSIFAGSGSAGHKDAKGTSAQFNSPTGVASDATGNIYVADANNHAIRKITPTGDVSTIAGSGKAGYKDANGILAEFNTPNGVVVDANGNIFVTDVLNTRIRKISPSGEVTTFAGGSLGNEDGNGASAKFGLLSWAIAIDSQGNLFVTDLSYQTVRKITPNAEVSTLAINIGSARGITVDTDGNVYTSDENNHIIRKIDPLGTVITFSGSGNQGNTNGIGISASYFSPNSLAIDSSGNLFVNDNGNGIIKKIQTNLSNVLIGETTGKVGTHNVTLTANDGNGGTATQTFTITVKGKPTVTISEATVITANGATLNGAITADGGASITERGFVYAKTTDDATPTLAEVDGTTVIKVTSDDTTDAFSKAISGLSVNTEYSFIAYATNSVGTTESTVQTFTTINTPPTFTSSPVLTVNEGATYAYTITTNDVDDDAVTVTATTKPNWLSIEQSKVHTTFAGSGTKASIDGTGVSASFNGLGRVVSDLKGNLYVSEYDGNIIRKITSTGVVTTIAGSGNNNDGGLDGIGLNASFNKPAGIALDNKGNLYIADTYNNKIRKLNLATNEVTTVAGDGQAAFKDGIGVNASFQTPGELVFDSTFENLYITDPGNYRIRKINIATNEVTTIAGNGSNVSVDGIGTSASFAYPLGITIDKDNNLYVTNLFSHSVRKIALATKEVTTFAGTGNSGNLDETGTKASFNNPAAIITDNKGNLFIAEVGNNQIRKINILTKKVTVFIKSNTNIQFSSPNGITMDDKGVFYVTNFGNHRISEIVVKQEHDLIGDTTGKVGTHDVTLEANDGNGGKATQSFTLNVVPKPIITIVAPTETNTAFTTTFTVNTEVNDFVANDITVTNGVLSNFTVNSTTEYTALVTPTTEGVVTIDIATDVVHNTLNVGNNSATFSVNYDNTPPTKPIITEISDYTCSGNTNVTGDNTLIIKGTAEKESTVEVFINNASIGTIQADSDGKFTFDNTQDELENATYKITAKSTDIANNTSESSDTFTVVVNTIDSDNNGVYDFCQSSTTVTAKQIGLSPDGDGVNDNWIIPGLEDFPNNKVTIFNRWGNVVFEKKGYTKEFTGISKAGEKLPDGTYYYVIDFGNGNYRKGYLIIKR